MKFYNLNFIKIGKKEHILITKKYKYFYYTSLNDKILEAYFTKRKAKEGHYFWLEQAKDKHSNIEKKLQILDKFVYYCPICKKEHDCFIVVIHISKKIWLKSVFFNAFYVYCGQSDFLIETPEFRNVNKGLGRLAWEGIFFLN